MTEVNEETLREFMRKHYPKYADNLSLARILYAKHVGKVSEGVIEVNTSKVNLFIGLKVKIVGVISSVFRRKYKVCTICGKTKCEHGSSGIDDGGSMKMVVSFRLSDNYGDIECIGWFRVGEIFLASDVGDDDLIGKEVEVIGRVVNDPREGVRIRIIDVREIAKDKEEGGNNDAKENNEFGEVLQIIMDLDGVSEEVLAKICSKRGLNKDELKRYMVLVDGKWKVKA